MAFAGIREEPTLWQLGAASGVSAALVSASTSLTVQSVNVSAIAQGLLAQKIVLHWPARPNCSCSQQNCTSYTAQDAGTTAINGVYVFKGAMSDGAPVFVRSDGSGVSLYRWVGEWRLADEGSRIFYTAPSAILAPLPPLKGTKSDGAKKFSAAPGVVVGGTHWCILGCICSKQTYLVVLGWTTAEAGTAPAPSLLCNM